MSKIIRDAICLATEKEVKSVLLMDSQSLSTDRNSFCRENELSYYVIINTWLLMLKDYTGFSFLSVKERICKHGLVSTIGYFNEAAELVINRDDETLKEDYGLAYTIMREVQSKLGHLPIYNFEGKNVGLETMATVLQLFRYPKRMSPLHTDLLRNQCLSDFNAEQNRLKLLQRREHSPFIVDYVRHQIQNILDWNAIIDDISNISMSDIEFTHGVGVNAASNIVSKLSALNKTHPSYFDAILLNRDIACKDEPTTNMYFRSNGKSYPCHIAKVIAVPKNYKANRIIAMEDTYRQAYAHRMFSIICSNLPDCINIYDQSRNQELARQGSKDQSLATIDLSHASDDIMVSTVHELFPSSLVYYLEKVRPTHYMIDGEVRLLHSFMTMGNSLTFIIETILFWAIASAACAFAGVQGPVSAYGDDIICPSEAATTVCEFLSYFGFTPNSSKTYSTGYFRESCGAEYLNGIDVSNYYAPRFPIMGTLGERCTLSEKVQFDGYTSEYSDTSTRLVALQKKLITFCPAASHLLREIILEANPRMTTSLIGETCDDLWGYDEVAFTRKLPAGLIECEDQRFMYSIHSRDHAPQLGSKQVRKRTLRRTDSDITEKVHLHPVTKQVKGKTVDSDLYDLYRYSQFLKRGPVYDDELSRLLGVSSPDITIERASGFIKLIWR